MATGPQARILELLKRFNDNQIVCIEQLQSEYLWEGMSERTIGRDLKVIKDYFPDSFELVHRGTKGEKGCYKAVTKDVFENFMDKDTLALMVQTFNIVQRNNVLQSLDISDADKRILQNKIDKTSDCYIFVSKPYERKKGDEKILKDLEKAINWNRYITIEHLQGENTVKYELKPYKIVFINENFYLAGENTLEESDEISKFSMFRINNIKSIQMHTKQFHQDRDLLDFIKSIQTPFPKYTYPFRENQIDVKLKVSPQKAKFFKMKKFFPSQTEQTQDDGSLVLSYKFTQEMEVESFIKSWIPHMQVIEPQSLKDKIESELQSYLNF
jgi:predicted DNA-binding transcriptional regulator YafY